MSDGSIKKNTPILILCNKQDETFAKGVAVVKLLLEKEINLLRFTRANNLDDNVKTASTPNFLGTSEKEFQFSQVNLNIDFAESSAYNKNADVDLNQLQDWLQKLL